MHKKGFTFVELLFVVIILGILIGISLPKLKNNFEGLRLNSFSKELQGFMNYLHECAVIEGRIIYLYISNEEKEYYAKIKNDTKISNNYLIPNNIKVETSQQEILFYPDGQIDKITIKLINPNNQSVTLTSKGVFGGVKLLSQK